MNYVIIKNFIITIFFCTRFRFGFAHLQHSKVSNFSVVCALYYKVYCAYIPSDGARLWPYRIKFRIPYSTSPCSVVYSALLYPAQQSPLVCFTLLTTLLCPLCLSAVNNEVHFVLCCPSFDDLRYKLMNPKYFNNPCKFQLALLVATQNERALKNLALCIKHSAEEKPCYCI